MKAARKRLVALGWLTALPAPQWYKNRFGNRVEVNQHWVGPSSVSATHHQASTTRLPRRLALSTTRTPPPVPDKKLLTEYKNQKPAFRGPAGAWSGRRRQGRTAPTLANVSREDLRNIERLLKLFDLAVEQRLLKASEHARLQFVAAAEHALAIGTRNPPGLFAQLVRKGLWRFINQADEDRARRRMSRYRESSRQHESSLRSSPGKSETAWARPGASDYVNRILESWSCRNATDAERLTVCIQEPHRLLASALPPG